MTCGEVEFGEVTGFRLARTSEISHIILYHLGHWKFREMVTVKRRNFAHFEKI